MDEGVVKYRCDWTQTEPVAVENIGDLIEWRDRLHSWGLIGVYENGIGFGNVSVRLGNSCQFIISGTQTAHLPSLGPEFYCTVTDFNLEENSIGCRGPVQASSESLTHAALYFHSEDIGGIIHVHNPQLWQQLLFKIPTTRKEIPYGTPGMALEMFRLFEEENLGDRKILAMAGHEDGVMCFGGSLGEAGKVLSGVLNRNDRGDGSAVSLRQINCRDTALPIGVNLRSNPARDCCLTIKSRSPRRKSPLLNPYSP